MLMLSRKLLTLPKMHDFSLQKLKKTGFLFFVYANASAFTVKNTVITPDFLVWRLCRNCAFPQNFHTRKLG